MSMLGTAEFCQKGAADLAVQLFAHSDYSLLESTITVSELVRCARDLGYDAVGLADHNTTGGHVELARACQDWGLTPVFGLELDVAHPDGNGCGDSRVSRLVFFAKGQQNYRHLQRLCSLPQPVAWHVLAEYAPGLVMTSGGLRGELYILAAAGRWDEVKQVAREYDVLFGPDWYVQLEWDTPAEFKTAQALAALFGESRCVASQNVCYLALDDRTALQVLTASRLEKKASEVMITARPLLGRKQFIEEFSRFPKALANTRQVLSQCAFELPRQQGLPRLPEAASLEEAVRVGAERRYGKLKGPVLERIQHELQVIREMGLADYFLIVADIVRYAKEQGIPVGPGRGSAASSVVAYCLGITEVDPLAYGLVFERFLNKARHSLPDIDLDFCYVRRSEVLDYVQRRFGRDYVAQIGTYGTFGLKAAESMVAEVLGSAVPVERRRQVAAKISGLKRHFSTHASGVVIAAQPITCYQAVRTDRSVPVTHGDMHALEWQGLLKIDLLGLRTLTFLRRVEEEVQRTDPAFRLDAVPLDDEKTYALLGRGDTMGVFQLESELFQGLLKQMQPRSFAELAALLALGRPGPLSLVPAYLANRAAPEKVQYSHPVLQEILGETYGLAVYQEQVIQLGHRLGGMSLSEADLLRIAISKKDAALIDRLARSFIAGCEQAGLSAKEARELFAAVRRFAGYAFNKSHSVCYALISYRAAYLKAHYPQAFFAALMEGHSGQALRPYLLACRRRGIPVYPPDIQLSDVGHHQEGAGVRLGLSAIKHVGEAAAEKIVKARESRPFQSLKDLRRRAEIPEHTLQALIQAGALDSVAERPALLAALGMMESRGLTAMQVERELLGAYLSDHPARRLTAFLRQISGGLAFAAGEVVEVRTNGGFTAGLIDDPGGLIEFVLPKQALAGKTLPQGSLVAVFGSFADGVLKGEWVFPLRPTVIVLPDPGRLEQLQQALIRHRGDCPVVLRLGREVLQILPAEYWVTWDSELAEELKGCAAAVQLFDPW